MRSKLHLIVWLAAVVPVLFGSCGLRSGDEGEAALQGEDHTRPDEAVRVSSGLDSALVRLPEPYTPEHDERSLRVSYRGDLRSLAIRLYGAADEPLREEPLPAPALIDGELSYQLPLGRGETLHAFRLVGGDTGGAGTEGGTETGAEGDAELIGARIEELRFAARFGDGEAALGGGAFWERDREVMRLRFGRALDSVSLEEQQAQVRISYRMPEDPARFWREAANPGREPEAIETALEGRTADGEASHRFRVVLQPGENTVFLYSGAAEFRPHALRIIGGHPEFELREIEVESVDRSIPGDDEFKPLPADLGTVIEYNQDLWRRPEYELFAWSSYPELIVLDVAALEYQSRMFKRLAFFYEKNEHRGTLLTNDELDGKHGWNAHNYSPEGLAAFFNLAGETEFPLNDEEHHLAALAEANGVIERRGGRFEPGVGGVLSFSRQLPWLRQVFLTHEAMHGLFYLVDEFREYSFEYWEALESEEREFWRLFFEFRDFDPEYEYLMVNEFQAYLLQQPVEIVEEYFLNTWIERLKADRRDRAGWISEFLERHPDTFSRSAKDLDRALWESTGFTAGDVLRVRRIRE